MIRLKVEHPRKVESLAKEEPSKIRISEPSETHLKFNEILTSCVRNRIYQIYFGALASASATYSSYGGPSGARSDGCRALVLSPPRHSHVLHIASATHSKCYTWHVLHTAALMYPVELVEMDAGHSHFHPLVIHNVLRRLFTPAQ